MPDDQMQYVQPNYNPANYNESVLRYQLDTEELLEEIECRVLAKKRVRDPKTGSIVLIPDGNSEPLINKTGWSRLRVYLRTHVDKMFALSDFDDDYLRTSIIQIAKGIVEMFFLHRKEFGIQSVSDATAMEMIISNSIYANMRRSYLGGYLGYLTTTHVHSENVNITNPSNRGMENQGDKQNLFMRIFGRGNK